MAQRIYSVTGISLIAGGLLGSVQASWAEASHVGVIRSTKMAMVQQTARVIGRSSLMFGVAGAVFAAGECAAQTYRADRHNGWQNQAAGGAAAGLAMGVMTRSLRGGLASAAALAFIAGVTSALPSKQ